MRLKKQVLTKELLTDALPDDSIKAAFFRRADIAKLSPPEQEARWKEARPRIERFTGWLVGKQGSVVDR